MYFPWLSYVRERFPLPLYLLLSCGSAWHGLYAVQTQPQAWQLVIGSVLLLLFFFCLRLMDEVKDYQKDLIAHPERPLPRGLISLASARRIISISLVCMIILGILPPLLDYRLASLLWLLTCAWLWLMYHEFFCHDWLEKRPILYAITHQLIIIPLISSVAMIGLHEWEPQILPHTIMLLGAFFSYEIARKLDPKIAPILRSYRLIYGRMGALGILFATSLLLMLGTYLSIGGNFQDYAFYWIVAILVPLSGWLYGETKPKWVEALAGLSLLVHIWGPTLVKFFFSLRI